MRKIPLLTIAVLIACGCGSPSPLAGSWDMVSTHPGQASRFVFDSGGTFKSMTKNQVNEASPVIEVDMAGKFTLVNNVLTITPDPKSLELKGGTPDMEKAAKSMPAPPMTLNLTWVNSDEFKAAGAPGQFISYKRTK